jgi:hypothetical protein
MAESGFAVLPLPRPAAPGSSAHPYSVAAAELFSHKAKPPLTIPEQCRIEWSSQSLGVDTAGPMFSGELAAYLRHRSLLAPELAIEPKPLEVDRTGATALRVSGVTAIGALVAWAWVSLPGVGQRSGNNNFHTAVPHNPASGTAHPAAAATAAVPASSSSTVSQSENITSRPDDEETSTLTQLSIGKVLRWPKLSLGKTELKRIIVDQPCHIICSGTAAATSPEMR